MFRIQARRYFGLLEVGAAIAVVMMGICGSAMSAEDCVYSSYYLPDAVDYAGSIHLYLNNPTQKPLTITAIELDDKSIGKVWITDRRLLGPDVRDEYVKVVNDGLAWYRVNPNPLPPGARAEVVLRLMPKACKTSRHQLKISFADHEPVAVTVPMHEPAFTVEYVAFSPTLDVVHIYARRQGESQAQLSRVEIDGQPVEAEIQRVFTDYRYAKVNLKKPLSKAGFHEVAIGTDRQLWAISIRAMPTPPPIGIMGDRGEKQLEQYANHLFDAILCFVGARSEHYDAIEKYGLVTASSYGRYLKPGQKKPEPVYYDQPERVAKHVNRAGLWAHFLGDEPDARYVNTDLPRLSIPRDVERANEFCRVLDPNRPSYLTIDHSGYPRNLYRYGQLPDYITAHCYTLGTDRVVGATKDHVFHTQAASRPRPFYYVACGYCQRMERRKEGRHWGRLCQPGEMHLEVHTALAGGVKSMQWYPAHGQYGLLKHPKMWNAVGRINGVLHQVLPLVSIGMPVDSPVLDKGKLLGSTILCGDKAMAVVLVNQDFSATAEKFEIRPVTATVSVRVPSFLKVRGVCKVNFPGKLEDLPATIDSSRVTFPMHVGTGAVAVIYTDESVLGQMRQVHAECLHEFVPMPEHP